MRPNFVEKNYAHFVLFTLCCALSMLPIEGWAEDPLLIPSLRAVSLGEAMVAVAADEDSVFYNPAGLQMVEESRLTLIGLRVNLNNDGAKTIRDFVDAYRDAKPPPGGKGVERIDRFSQKSLKKLRKQDPLLRLSGPIQLAYVRRGVAVTLFNSDIVGRPDVEGTSNIHFRGRGDAFGALSLAKTVYRNLSAGITFKYLVRSEIGKGGTGPKLSAVLLREENMVLKRGWGIDIGLLYRIQRPGLAVGLTWLDFSGTSLAIQDYELNRFGRVGESGNSTIPSRFALGVSYQPDFKFPVKALAYMPEQLTVAFAFTSGDSFNERLHLGVEMKPYRWLALRAGVHQGIRLGIGLRGKTMALDYMFAPSLTDPYLDEKTENTHAFSWRWGY
jgi:hypothetical protein